MKKNISFCLILTVSVFMFSKNALSWDNEKTHQDLSKYAAENSVLSKTKGDYLKNLSFNKGLEEIFIWNNRGLDVIKWFQEGADFEDIGTVFEMATNKARSNNHFHNPLKGWQNAGLDDYVLGLHVSGESALVWAQDSIKQSNATEGNWSWKTVRDYYYKALTMQSHTVRQEYFAKTFRGLGHQMHLIQDAAQPDHVRNDAHAADAIGLRTKDEVLGMETWAKGKPALINSFASSPMLPNISLNISYDGYVPITQFIDTKQYYAGKTPLNSLSQGLAEYTNANFASEDTVFTEERAVDDNHYFPYPRKSSTDVQSYISQDKLREEVIGEDNIPDTAFWIAKTGDGEKYAHFAKPGYFTNNVYSNIGGGIIYNRTFILDETCHEDYAKLLIPRAVGYSAGLLNYFFRGDMDMEKDKNNPSQYYIKNLSNESMSGTFRLFYDDTSGNRQQVSGGSWESPTINPGCKNSGVTFTPPTDAKEPGKYILVLDKGKIGEEDGAVAGKVIDINTIQTSSDTLTITGSETTTRNSTKQYTASGCSSGLEWTVSGKGATINKTSGLLTTDGSACGTLTFTATCAGCGTSATQSVMVTNAVCWEQTSSEPAPSPNGGSCSVGSYIYSGFYDYVLNPWRETTGMWIDASVSAPSRWAENPLYQSWISCIAGRGYGYTSCMAFRFASGPGEVKMVFYNYYSPYGGASCYTTGNCALTTGSLITQVYTKEMYKEDGILKYRNAYHEATWPLTSNPSTGPCYYYIGTMTFQRR